MLCVFLPSQSNVIGQPDDTSGLSPTVIYVCSECMNRFQYLDEVIKFEVGYNKDTFHRSFTKSRIDRYATCQLKQNKPCVVTYRKLNNFNHTER